jgi:hypothetical protein
VHALPQPARDVLCVLCLVLGGLEALERDLGVPPRLKAAELRCFHLTIFKRCVGEGMSGLGVHAPCTPLVEGTCRLLAGA